MAPPAGRRPRSAGRTPRPGPRPVAGRPPSRPQVEPQSRARRPRRPARPNPRGAAPAAARPARRAGRPGPAPVSSAPGGRRPVQRGDEASRSTECTTSAYSPPTGLVGLQLPDEVPGERQIGTLGGLRCRLLVPVLPHVADPEPGQEADVARREGLGDHDQGHLPRCRPAAGAAAAIRPRPARRARFAASSAFGPSMPSVASRRQPDDPASPPGDAVAAVRVEVARLEGAAADRSTSRRLRRAAGPSTARTSSPACPRSSSPARRHARQTSPASRRHLVAAAADGRADGPRSDGRAPSPASPRRPRARRPAISPGGRRGRREPTPATGVGEQHGHAVGGQDAEGPARARGDHGVDLRHRGRPGRRHGRRPRPPRCRAPGS